MAVFLKSFCCAIIVLPLRFFALFSGNIRACSSVKPEPTTKSPVRAISPFAWCVANVLAARYARSPSSISAGTFPSNRTTGRCCACVLNNCCTRRTICCLSRAPDSLENAAQRYFGQLIERALPPGPTVADTVTPSGADISRCRRRNARATRPRLSGGRY